MINQIVVFYHVIKSLYKWLMTIMIISNAKGFQNNKYIIIHLCKLGNITDYIYIYISIYFLIYEIIIGVTPMV